MAEDEQGLDLTDTEPDTRRRSVLISFDPVADVFEYELFNCYPHELPGMFREILGQVFGDSEGMDFEGEL